MNKEEMIEDYPRLKAYTNDLEQDFKELYQALLDIKEYIEHYGNIYVLKDNQLKNVYQWKELLGIINKALGDKE